MKYRQLRFNRSAGTYHQVSEFQKHMAEELIKILPEDLFLPNILELGCGTGHMSNVLLRRFPLSRLTISDISEKMLDECQQKMPIGSFRGTVSWMMIDAEENIPINNLSLICSNAMIQWVDDINRHFQLLSKSLCAGGIILFSGFSRSNFTELNTILKLPPFGIKEFPGHDITEIKSSLTACGFTVIHLEQQKKQILYPSFLYFLRKLKSMGASGRPGLTMTRGKMKSIEASLKRFYSIGSHIQITWMPWYCMAQKSPISPSS